MDFSCLQGQRYSLTVSKTVSSASLWWKMIRGGGLGLAFCKLPTKLSSPSLTSVGQGEKKRWSPLSPRGESSPQEHLLQSTSTYCAVTSSMGCPVKICSSMVLSMGPWSWELRTVWMGRRRNAAYKRMTSKSDPSLKVQRWMKWCSWGGKWNTAKKGITSMANPSVVVQRWMKQCGWRKKKMHHTNRWSWWVSPH